MINKKDYKVIGPFKGWVLQNFPFIEADFDAITSYQLWCKVVEYLNKVIYNEALLEEQSDELVDAFNELKTYVDNYFNNLDVQEEINQKLDDLVTDGTLGNIINNDLFSDINNKILQNTLDISRNTEDLEDTIKYNQANSVNMNMLTQEVREALTGGSTAVVGTNSVGESNIKDKAITIFKLDDYLQKTKSISYGEPISLGDRYAGFMKNVDGVATVDTGSASYSHYIVNLTKDKIYNFTGYNLSQSNGLLVVDSEDNIIYQAIDTTTGFHMGNLVFKVNDTGLKAYLSIYNGYYDQTTSQAVSRCLRYNTPLLREINILTNNYKKITPRLIRKIEGHYASIVLDDKDQPSLPEYGTSNVLMYEMCKGLHYKITSFNWSQSVGIYILGLDNSIIYQSSDASVGANYINIEREFVATQDGFILLAERPTAGHYSSITILDDLNSNLGFNKWFALGDSLTEKNFRASKNYLDYIKEELGITVVNLGHSSAGYMHSNSDEQNFRTEITEIGGYNYDTDIITVMGSINDFQHIASDLGQLGDTTTDTIYGCMYTFCNNLFTSYIGARIGIICPPATGTYHTNYSNFQAYNTALKETAKLFAIPVLDLSEKCNLKPWIEDFRNTFFKADGTGNTGQVDQTHPNSKGHWLIHNAIKEFIKTL